MEPREQLAEALRKFFSDYGENPEQYPDADAIKEDIGGDYLEEVTHDEYMEEMEKALTDAGVDEATRESVMDQYEQQVDEYGPEGIAKHLTIVVNDQDVTNDIYNDNTVEVHGDNKAPIHQSNDTDVANATAEGAVAGGEGDTQANTGDGVQAGQDINTHGDLNSGDGNISADGAHFDRSAVSFGEGDSYNEANDDNSTNTNLDVDAKITDSFDHEDNDTVDATATVDVDAGGYGEHEYEVPTYEEPEAPKYEHEEPKYEQPEEPHYEPEPELEYDS